DRRLRIVAGRLEIRRPRPIQTCVVAASTRIRPDCRREAPDVCVGSWPRVFRHAGGSSDSSRSRVLELSLGFADPGHPQERPLPIHGIIERTGRIMMFVTRTSIPRRQALRGLGVAIGLPLLDCMVPAFATAADTKPLARFGAVYVPNGMDMSRWTPE